MALPHPQGLDFPAAPGFPKAQGLYDPANEKDACGVAFVADLYGRRSHDVVAKGLSALIRLDHRGARGAEYNTGDGAGIMIQVPDAFYRSITDFELPAPGHYAAGLVFLPNDPAEAARAVAVFEKYALVEGGDILGWRDVPVQPAGLGETADAARPLIRQVFLGAHRLTGTKDGGRAGAQLSGLELDRVAFCIRKQTERETQQRGVGAYFPSLSRPHDHVQGDADPRPAAVVLPRPHRRAGRQRDRAGALPVLHQHVPVLAAGAPRTGSSRTTARSTRSAATRTGWPPAKRCWPRRTCPATSSGCSRSAPRRPPTRRTSTPSWSCCTCPGAACRTPC